MSWVTEPCFALYSKNVCLMTTVGLSLNQMSRSFSSCWLHFSTFFLPLSLVTRNTILSLRLLPRYSNPRVLSFARSRPATVAAATRGPPGTPTPRGARPTTGRPSQRARRRGRTLPPTPGDPQRRVTHRRTRVLEQRTMSGTMSGTTSSRQEVTPSRSPERAGLCKGAELRAPA